MKISELQKLAGITEKKSKSVSNISNTAAEKAKIMKKRKKITFTGYAKSYLILKPFKTSFQ